jgi:uncharacterized membrane protein YgaE (UPF0421/DUF939 family)
VSRRREENQRTSVSADDATGTVKRRVASAVSGALERIRDDAWRLVQATAAATVAWLLAEHVLDHPDPFFAPISALVALNTSLGERGLNALRLLQGVVLGIAVGELTLNVIGDGWGSMAFAILAATVLARALAGPPIAVAQAAASAILVVATADAATGPERFTDALLGAGVALVFSQLLFSPEPIRLVRRFESEALRVMAAGLDLGAQALDEDDDELGERALAELRSLPDRVTELRRMRRASDRVARRTLMWRTQRKLVVQENENAGHLDLLAGSCVTLARLISFVPASERQTLQPSVRGLADVLAALAVDLGDRQTRQDAAERALEVANAVADATAEPDSPLAAAITGVRLVATDLMVYAGVELEDATAAVREGILERKVPTPPTAPRGIRGRLKSLLRR